MSGYELEKSKEIVKGITAGKNDKLLEDIKKTVIAVSISAASIFLIKLGEGLLDVLSNGSGTNETDRLL